MKNLSFLVLILFNQIAFSQQLKQVEIPADGKMEWQFLLPLEQNGLVLFYKNEMTKGSIVRFDKDLNISWQSDFFIDAERGPKSYSVNKDKLSLMFSENNGAYYQIYEVNLADGKIKNYGFEITELFNDQDFVLTKKGVLVGGSNDKGAAVYNFNEENGSGELVQKDLTGIVSVQSFQLNEKTGNVEAIFAVQKIIEQTAKQKKANAKPIVIGSEIVFLEINQEGEVIQKIIIQGENGNNPMNARVLRVSNSEFFLSGTFRNPSGKQGVYASKIIDGKKSFIKFYDFQTITKNSDLSAEQLKILVDQFSYSLHEIEFKENQFVIAGEFFRPEYKTTTEYVNSPYGNNYGGSYGGFGRSNYYDPFNNNRQQTQSKQVFVGYRYASGLVYTFDNDGNLKSNNLIGIDKVSREVSESFAFSSNNELALCKNGKIIVTRLDDPGIQQTYQITAENTTNNKAGLPVYNSVKHWYDNIFIGTGVRNQTEVIKNSIDDLPVEKGLFGKKKKRIQTQSIKIKRIIYLTKIAS
jgi:hypothetical protein